MKLTFCTYDSPTIHGGPMSWSTRFLPALRDLGYEIEIIFFTEGDIKKCKFIEFFKKEGFVIYHYPYVSFSYFKIRWILNVLKNNNTDIFIPNGFAHAFYAAKWVKQAGIPTLGILHSDDEYHYGEIEEFISNDSEYRISGVVSVSKLLHDKIQLLQIKDLLSVCIPYGAPTSFCKTDFENPKTKLLYIGRLSEWQKRISETTHALCRAVNEIENIEVMMYGGGDVETVRYIINEHQVADKVILGGLLDSDKVQEEMIKYDIFVLLSDFEGLPIALMEAMACALVPVCKNIESGIPELITNRETGLLVNDRGDEFVQAIRLLHENKQLAKELALNARNKIMDGYSSEFSVKQWDGFLKKMQAGYNNKKTIQIPLFFLLPKVNTKLLREDFRIYAFRSNLMRFVINPVKSVIKLNIRNVIIQLGWGKYFLKSNF